MVARVGSVLEKMSLTPYYQDQYATIYHGDCREILPMIEPVDLVLTDPPYGISYSHGKGGGKLARSTAFDHHPIVGDDRPFDPQPFLSFPDAVLWGANHYASRLPDSACWLVWDKREGVCSNDQADCEMAWTTLKQPARLNRHLWNGMLKKSERGERRCHPTQKPIAIMKWCLGFFPKVKTVLDPFMGSGTTLRAAKDLGLKSIGIELEEKYCEIAANRLRQDVLSSVMENAA